ncbi:toll/interleukin-1 receptor domain-containing protein [Roseovarius nubinhibens]|nr:toll/interleukin-1 receptor domain-containing protein [Roseovarius nubinhibens]
MSKVFFSYSHADEELADMLQKHLAAMKNNGLITTWHDRCIRAGDEFGHEIDKNLNDADVILLLISSDFIASRYCYEIEMARAIERHEAKEARVIPVILRPCDWHDTPFGKLLAAPRDGKPIRKWPDLDEAFLDVVNAIKASIKKPDVETITRPVTEKMTSVNMVVDRPRSANLRVKKSFTQADKDHFLDDAFDLMKRYFENSLNELTDRYSELSSRFRLIDSNRFTAVIYRNGEDIARCKIVLGGMFGKTITYSANDQASDNSCNESLSIDADDQHIYLSAMGIPFGGNVTDKKLTAEGAAEYYWSILMQPLQ